MLQILRFFCLFEVVQTVFWMLWRDLGCARSVGRIVGYYMLSNLIQIFLVCLEDIDSICVSCLGR